MLPRPFPRVPLPVWVSSSVRSFCLHGFCQVWRSLHLGEFPAEQCELFVEAVNLEIVGLGGVGLGVVCLGVVGVGACTLRR